MTSTDTRQSTLPSADDLRARVHEALAAVLGRAADTELSAPGGDGVPSSSPVNGEALFTVNDGTARDTETAITAAAEAFSLWRTTPAPVRGSGTR